MSARKMTPERLQLAAAAYAEGQTYEQIGALWGITSCTVSKALRDRAGIKTRERYCKQRGEHACSRCGEMHTRKHAYCAACWRIYMSSYPGPERRNGEKYTAAECSNPPPPPPGFSERDLQIGRPLD